MLQVNPMSSHQRRAGTRMCTRTSAPSTSAPSTYLERDRFAAAGAVGGDAAVAVKRSRDAQRIPGARSRPLTTGGRDRVRRRREAEGVRHPDLGRVREEDERMRIVQTPVGVGDLEAPAIRARRPSLTSSAAAHSQRPRSRRGGAHRGRRRPRGDRRTLRTFPQQNPCARRSDSAPKLRAWGA